MDQSVPYIIKEIPLSDIVFPANEMRTQVCLEGLDDLSRSIRQVGLLNPISVRPKDGKFELIAGFRRTKACEMANMPTVPARVFNSSDNIADLQKAHENLFREDVNPLDEGTYYKLLLTKHNWVLQDLALAVHKSVSYVSRRVSLVECPDDVKEALKEGKINLTVAEELTKIPDPTARIRMLYLVIQNGATADVVRTWRIQYETEQYYHNAKKDENAGAAPGTPPIDPTKMGMLTDDKGPDYSLEETVQRFRICHSCLAKVDETLARLLILCPTCAKSIETFLPGGRDIPK